MTNSTATAADAARAQSDLQAALKLASPYATRDQSLTGVYFHPQNAPDPVWGVREVRHPRACFERRIINGHLSCRRLLGILKTRLDQAGWEDNLRGVAREKARGQEPPNLQLLVKDLEPEALKTVPLDVRTEIEELIRNFVEKNVED
ncbi:enhancer of yellow 2 transcription factor, partial [Phenoliferia sp. Uapishka_3]